MITKEISQEKSDRAKDSTVESYRREATLTDGNVVTTRLVSSKEQSCRLIELPELKFRIVQAKVTLVQSFFSLYIKFYITSSIYE